MRRALVALASVAVAACASTGSSPLPDAPPDDPSLGGGNVPKDDPLASDASLGVRAASVLAGCEGGPESGCHAMGAGGTHLALGAGGDLIDVPSSERPALRRIAPGDPPRSYLYLKVLGDGGIDGSRMPSGGPFDPRLAPFLASWIDAGAP